MKTIPLTIGVSAIVDDEDYEWAMQWNWFRDGDGYAQRTGPGRKRIAMHVEIAKRAGLPPSPMYDHRDLNPLNNCRGNLRPCNKSLNAANSRKRPFCTSKYKGVTWNRRERKWKSRITVMNKEISLGTFTDEREAASAYQTAAVKHFGEFARV